MVVRRSEKFLERFRNITLILHLILIHGHFFVLFFEWQKLLLILEIHPIFHYNIIFIIKIMMSFLIFENAYKLTDYFYKDIISYKLNTKYFFIKLLKIFIIKLLIFYCLFFSFYSLEKYSYFDTKKIPSNCDYNFINILTFSSNIFDTNTCGLMTWTHSVLLQLFCIFPILFLSRKL